MALSNICSNHHPFACPMLYQLILNFLAFAHMRRKGAFLDNQQHDADPPLPSRASFSDDFQGNVTFYLRLLDCQLFYHGNSTGRLSPGKDASASRFRIVLWKELLESC